MKESMWPLIGCALAIAAALTLLAVAEGLQPEPVAAGAPAGD